MKQQKEFYVIATDNNNRFLAEYKNNDRALTFNAKTTDDIRFALIFEKEDEETTDSYPMLDSEAVRYRLSGIAHYKFRKVVFSFSKYRRA